MSISVYVFKRREISYKHIIEFTHEQIYTYLN